MTSYRTMPAGLTVLVCLAALLGGCKSDRIDECMAYYHAPLVQAICIGTEDVPNNTLDNATVLTTAGAIIEDSVQRQVDDSDFFVFTPPQTGPYRIRVCEGGCDEAELADAIFIMLYDQTRTTIAGTPIGVLEKQEITTDLTAGVAYYIEVNGYNADALPYPYRLTVRQVTELLE